MRKSIRSELRMLRELVWHIGIHERCYFCGKRLLEDTGTLKFGERSCPPVKVALVIHHRNHKHEDNQTRNRKLAHSSCHKRYHIQLQHKKEKGRRIGTRHKERGIE